MGLTDRSNAFKVLPDWWNVKILFIFQQFQVTSPSVMPFQTLL